VTIRLIPVSEPFPCAQQNGGETVT
jgi:hypothetical protein